MGRKHTIEVTKEPSSFTVKLNVLAPGEIVREPNPQILEVTNSLDRETINVEVWAGVHRGFTTRDEQELSLASI